MVFVPAGWEFEETSDKLNFIIVKYKSWFFLNKLNKLELLECMRKQGYKVIGDIWWLNGRMTFEKRFNEVDKTD